MNPVKVFQAQPRFFIAALVGALLWLLLPRDWRASTGCWWPGIAPQGFT